MHRAAWSRGSRGAFRQGDRASCGKPGAKSGAGRGVAAAPIGGLGIAGRSHVVAGVCGSCGSASAGDTQNSQCRVGTGSRGPFDATSSTSSNSSDSTCRRLFRSRRNGSNLSSSSTELKTSDVTPTKPSGSSWTLALSLPQDGAVCDARDVLGKRLEADVRLGKYFFRP